MAQDWGPHTPLLTDISAMIELVLAETIGDRHQLSSLPIGIHSRIKGFLEGWYTAQDAVGLIAYDIIRCAHKHGDVVAAMPLIAALEEAMVQRLQKD